MESLGLFFILFYFFIIRSEGIKTHGLSRPPPSRRCATTLKRLPFMLVKYILAVDIGNKEEKEKREKEKFVIEDIYINLN